MRLRQAARKRRRLPVRAAPRHLEFFFQPFVFAAQPIAFDLRAHQIFAQPFDLSRLIVDDLLRVTRRRDPSGAEARARLCQIPRKKYKQIMSGRQV